MINELIKQIVLKREDELKTNQRVYRQDRPRASSIGECDREIWNSIVNWKHKEPYDTKTIARFEEGERQEKFIIQMLIRNGFNVVESQIDLECRDRKGRVILTGHIDGKIEWEGKRIPFEVKSMNPNIYEQINTLEDFGKYEWTRKYPRQLQTYLFANNEEEGFFIITDCLGHFKIIPIKLNFEEMESILQRCERIMDAVESGEAPGFYKDGSICRRCWAFGRVCHPDVSLDETQLIQDFEIEEALRERDQTSKEYKRYQEADTKVKAFFKGKRSSICGDYIITGQSRVERREATEAKTIEKWITKIERLGDKKEE